jgi:hypothetical protein
MDKKPTKKPVKKDKPLKLNMSFEQALKTAATTVVKKKKK